MEAQNIFHDITTRPHDTSAGPCPLPFLIHDGSLLTAFFRVPVEAARSCIDSGFEGGASIEPWPILGAAVVLLCAFEYRDTTVGPYNEFGLGVVARRKGTSPSLLRLVRDASAQTDYGIYVVNLPVTTEGARAAGVELWGYPKYVTDIKTSFEPAKTAAAIPGEFELSVGALKGPVTKGLPIVTFTALNGRLLRTVIDVRNKVQWGGSASALLKVTGDGPTARSMRSLGLDGAKPVATFRTEALRSVLPAGVDVGSAK